MKSMDDTAFEALCKLASKEKWCWNISCTTCGHMYFRYAFIELLSGGNPTKPNWITKVGNHHILYEQLGDSVDAINRLSIDSQDILIEIFSRSSIKKIMESCTFPDWLGYLGLALNYTKSAELKSRKLTKLWIPQLLELVSSRSPLHNKLNGILRDPKSIIVWYDLEEFEQDIKYLRCNSSYGDEK